MKLNFLTLTFLVAMTVGAVAQYIGLPMPGFNVGPPISFTAPPSNNICLLDQPSPCAGGLN